MIEILDFVGRIGQDSGWPRSALELLLRVTVLLLVAMLIAFGLRRSSAALRHLIWTLSLAGTLLVAPLCWVFPAWQWAILPERQESPPPSVTAVAIVTPLEAPLRSADASGPPLDESFDAAAMPPATTVAPSSPPQPPQSTWSWPAFLAGIWALGTVLGLVWLGVGMAGAWHVARRAQSAGDSPWRETLRQLLDQCGFRRPVEVRQCPDVSVPMTWGLLRPVILVPSGSEAWSEETKRTVLLHELGHIRRGDCLIHLLGRLACTIYWFHPLVWLAARQLRKTSEQAADDMVLSSRIAPPDYAEHLVEIAGQIRGAHFFGHVALPMASPSDLEGRVLAILDSQRNHRTLKRKTGYALMVVAVLLLIPCALLRLGHSQNKQSQEATSTAENSPGNNASQPSGKSHTVTNDKEPAKANEKADEAPVDVLVLTPDGGPVADADVQAYDTFVAIQTYRTDGRGSFRIPGKWLNAKDHVYFLVAHKGESVGWRWLRWPFDQPAADKSVEQPLRITLLPRSRTIEGSCIDAQGRPISGVSVRFANFSNVAGIHRMPMLAEWLGSATSDPRGRYAIKVPQFQRCDVVAEHPQYVPVATSYQGDHPGPKQIVLNERAGTVQGRVIDSAIGVPIRGAVIFAQSQVPRVGAAGVRESVSGENGQFTLGSMAPGVWNVLFRRIPDKPEWTAAAVEGVEVKAGEVARADLRAAPGRLLRGQVFDAAKDAPLADVSVGYYGSARPRSGAACLMVKTDAEGRFEFHVPPGESYVYVAQSFEGRPSSRTLIVEPDRDPEPVVFRGALSEGHLTFATTAPIKDQLASRDASADDASYTVRGTCYAPDGKPVPQAHIQVWRQGSSTSSQIGVYPGKEFRIFLGVRMFDNKGHRNLVLEEQFYRNLIGKTCCLLVDAPGYARSQPIEFVFAKDIKPLAIQLERPIYVRVRGRVLDAKGEPVPKANVSVSLSTVGRAVEEPWGPEYLTAPDGRFELKHVYVGKRFAVRIEKEHYRAAASPRMLVKNGDPIDLGDLRLETAEPGQAPPKTESRAKAAPSQPTAGSQPPAAHRIGLGESAASTGKVSVEPDARRTVVLSGVVVDENGKPLADVSVRTLTHGEREPVAHSDAAGHFQLHVARDRARGLALVARTADGAAQAYFHFGWNVDPATAALPPARLTVVAARSIVVQVVDDSGKPVADAVVGVVANYVGLETGRSDQQGKLTLRVPAEAPLQNIYAFKSGLGLDYLAFPKAERATTSDQPQPPDLSRPQVLRLTGARTVGIKLIDPEDRPISGILLRPWYFQKPQWGQSDGLNISGVKDFGKTTDAAGTAVFDWIPVWNKQSITFWPSGGNRWANNRIAWDPQEGPPQITVRLQRTVPVRGQVRHKDGSPAAGILIQAEGEWHFVSTAADITRAPDHFRGRTWTDENGKFEIRVDPDLIYLFAINDEHWAAAARGGVAARPDTPVEGIDFQLFRPPTRLHGQLTLGPEEKPWPGQTITLVQQSPDPQSPGPSIRRWTTTDAQGRYTFAVGPGRYELWGPASYPRRRSFTVTDEKELAHDLHAEERELAHDLHAARKERGTITIRVVDGSDPPRPVARAQVVVLPFPSMSHINLEATTNSEGWFRVERWLDKMIVAAQSNDKKRAGSVIISGDDAEATFPLQPSGTAKGQVIDQATGQPAADRTIQYEVPWRWRYEIPNVRGVGRSFLVGSARTDAQGRFQIDALVPGLEYLLTVPLFKDADPFEQHRYDELGKVTVKSGETVDLGNVKFHRDFAPGELLGVVLANRSPLDGRLKELADEGPKRGKRILIMFRDPTGEASRRHLTEITHNDLKPFADYRIISSPVDSRQLEAAKAAYAKKWESDLFAESWPLFCILEVDGSTLAVKNTREFVKQDEVDDSLVREFVQKYALNRPR